MSMDTASTSIGRRDFLTGSLIAAGAIRPSAVRGSQANSAITLGMIGCGGRGTWIADLFEKSGKFRLVACADYYQDRADAFGERFRIDRSRRHTTLSGYKRLLDGAVDAVAIETPPWFHPSQTADAVAAGKHVFLAKPIAVDVPGCLSVAESGRRATRARRVLLVDFQTRANHVFIEAVRRVHQGAIGRLISAQVAYLWPGLVHDAPLSSPEDRLRLWYQNRALCGDIIVEQDIHTLDVATWFANSDPVSAVGTCGRGVRHTGDIHDHFAVNFQFPDGFVVSFLSQKGVPSIPDEMRCRVFGTEGVADTEYAGLVTITGRHPFPGGRTPDMYTSGAVRNIQEFHRRIAGREYDNPTVAPSVRSNLTCVLGRTAAYRRMEVTWKQMLSSGQALKPDLSGLRA